MHFKKDNSPNKSSGGHQYIINDSIPKRDLYSIEIRGFI
jgi:hypothetical protein